MQKKISRREFIRMAGLTAAGTALAACAPTAAPTAAPAAPKPQQLTQAPAVSKTDRNHPLELAGCIGWRSLAADDRQFQRSSQG